MKTNYHHELEIVKKKQEKNKRERLTVTVICYPRIPNISERQPYWFAILETKIYKKKKKLNFKVFN